MVKTNYLLDHPKAPDRLKMIVDQRLIPIAIDAAGMVETALERVAQRVRQSPQQSICAAVAAGAILSILARPFRPIR